MKEGLNPFDGYVRDENGDRPELILPCGDNRLPQLIGFKTKEGTPIQVSAKMAEEWGVSVVKAKQTSNLYLEKIVFKRK